MIIIEHKNKEYQLKSEPHEFTLRDLIEVNEIMDQKNKETVEKYLEVVEHIGGKEIADAMSMKDLSIFMEKLNINPKSGKIPTSFKINDIEYSIKTDGEDIDITAKELVVIERFIKREPKWGHLVFALLYKQEGMTSNDNLNFGHIRKKADLFLDNVTADIASPVIIAASKQVIDNVERMTKAVANT